MLILSRPTVWGDAMHIYKYVVEDKSGMIFKGSVKAQNREFALSKVPYNHKLLDLKDAGPAVELPAWVNKRFHLERVPPKVLVDFFSQFGYMITAGISYQKALMTLGTTGSEKSRLLAGRLLERVALGDTLSQAFIACNDIVDDKYAKLIQVGDSAGNLSETLAQLAEQIQAELDTKAKIKTAMSYPTFVFIFALGAAYFVFTAIIPQVASLTKEINGADLPAITKIVMSISDMLVRLGPIALVLIVVSFIVIRRIVLRFFRLQWDTFKLKVPVFGKLIRDSDFVVFYQNLVFMMEAGFPVNVAFRQACDTVENTQIKRQLLYGYDRLLDGNALPQALSGLGVIKSSEVQTLQIGQDSGRLGELAAIMLSNMRKEISRSTSQLLTVLDPLLTILLLGIVGPLVFSVYAPILNMTQF